VAVVRVPPYELLPEADERRRRPAGVFARKRL